MIMRQQFRDGLIRPHGQELSTTAAADEPIEYGKTVWSLVASLCLSGERVGYYSRVETDGPRINPLGW